MIKKKILFEYTKRRKGDSAFLVCNISKAKSKLKWQPLYSDIKSILKDAHEVVYYISMLSTTGQKLKVSSDEIKKRFNLIKKISPDKKCIIGFGITADTISDFKDTDACVVGSALCREITKSIDKELNPATNVGNMVSDLKQKLSS